MYSSILQLIPKLCCLISTALWHAREFCELAVEPHSEKKELIRVGEIPRGS